MFDLVFDIDLASVVVLEKAQALVLLHLGLHLLGEVIPEHEDWPIRGPFIIFDLFKSQVRRLCPN